MPETQRLHRPRLLKVQFSYTVVQYQLSAHYFISFVFTTYKRLYNFHMNQLELFLIKLEICTVPLQYN